MMPVRKKAVRAIIEVIVKKKHPGMEKDERQAISFEISQQIE